MVAVVTTINDERTDSHHDYKYENWLVFVVVEVQAPKMKVPDEKKVPPSQRTEKVPAIRLDLSRERRFFPAAFIGLCAQWRPASCLFAMSLHGDFGIPTEFRERLATGRLTISMGFWLCAKLYLRAWLSGKSHDRDGALKGNFHTRR